ENIHGLVREMEESSLLRSVRAVERMPTGFYSVEHAENDEEHEHERITQCNDRFVEILGLKSKEHAIGKNIVKLSHTPEIKKNSLRIYMKLIKKVNPYLTIRLKLEGVMVNPFTFQSMYTW
ncbi:MAG: PAS domain-containing protein, partial [Candidatus Aenigmarchaeota archaeon]|nr:PAS domain-containing protein [Candidatus Aenigmarchaeota archaeon]